MKPVPQLQLDPSGHYPPLRLRAWCLAGWHPVIVGTPFQFADEPVELGTRTVTFAEWDRWQFENTTGFGFKRKVKLFCVKCDRVTAHTPKGVVEGS